jgi:hypothetical protein
MSFYSWLRNSTSTRSSRWHGLPIRPTPRRIRPRLEALEDRWLPSTFYAATASDLIADINAANLQGGANTIVLTATSPYVMTAADNTADGGNVLPVITAGDNLTILTNNGSANPGFGDAIDAGKHGRLFDVAQGASLTLENVTLQNGLGGIVPVVGQLATSKGGAIYNQGTLVLSDVMVQNNTAGNHFQAAGGGIWSNGSLTVENGSVFQGNSAIGGYYAYPGPYQDAYGGAIYIAGGAADISSTFFGIYNGNAHGVGVLQGNTAEGAGGLYPGKAYGGAVYVGGGTVTMSGDTLGLPRYNNMPPMNTAQSGGSAGVAGWGYGGALCLAGGTVILTNDSITNNEAGAGPDAFGDYAIGYGGGIYISSGAKVYLDSFTKANTNNNFAANILGPYILQTYPLLQITGFPSPSTAGMSESFTVTALTSPGIDWTSYTGTVHFTSSDPQAVLPTDYTFTSADQGVHTFTAVLKTAGSQTITVTDATTGSITGAEGIAVTAAVASNLVVAGFPSSTTAGAAGSFAVTARDPYGNIATGYLGTLHFKSSDGNASLPADYTFTAGDAGVHTFSATLKTAGTQSISATDIVFAGINGSETGIKVNLAVASRLAVTAPATVTAGAPFSITVTALDASGNVVTGYRGTIRISSVNGKGNLPSSYTFTAADNGVHTFTGVLLNKIAKHTITMTDTLNGTIVGSVIVDVV